MPKTSEIADKLADDLVALGKINGYTSTKEAPVFDGSSYCVDVLWKIAKAINLASIEIQYSNSPTSISHNVFKAELTLHPAIHVVISYNKLTGDYKEILSDYPAIVLIEGKNEVDEFHCDILRILKEPNEANQTILLNDFLDSFKRHKNTDNEKEKLIHDLWVERFFEPVVYEIAVTANLFDKKGTIGHTYFVTGTIDEAKANAVRLFEERMTDVPFDWDEKIISLKTLEITCYQKLSPLKNKIKKLENIVSKVIIEGKIGSKENYFEFADSYFGRDPKAVEKMLYENLKAEVQRLKSFYQNIFEKQVHVERYFKIKSWTETIKGEIVLVTREIPAIEEQKEKLTAYFNKKFGLEINELLSLDEISSTARYSENFDCIKERLQEIFERYPDDFRMRMHEDDFRRLWDWLGFP